MTLHLSRKIAGGNRDGRIDTNKDGKRDWVGVEQRSRKLDK